MRRTSYGFGKDLEMTFEQALEKTPAALKEQGFGVLTEIDVKAVMKKKRNVDFRKYVILGACNPPFAHQALEAEIDIGLLLPCNVIVYENDQGKATVMAIDPVAALGMVDRPEMAELAGQVRDSLEKAIEAL